MYLERLLLRVPLKDANRERMIAFLEDQLGQALIDFSAPGVETHLREVTHLMMSTPEYQLA